MTKNEINHQDLITRLRGDKEAEEYFLAVLEKCKTEDKEEAQKQLIEALKNLTEAHGGFANFAEKIGLGSTSFYKILSSIILKFVR